MTAVSTGPRFGGVTRSSKTYQDVPVPICPFAGPEEEVEVDHAARPPDHPLERRAIVPAVAVDIDGADQGEPLPGEGPWRHQYADDPGEEGGDRHDGHRPPHRESHAR